LATPYLYDSVTHWILEKLLTLRQKVLPLRGHLNYALIAYMTDTVLVACKCCLATEASEHICSVLLWCAAMACCWVLLAGGVP
jgi:hypothetical protein